MPSFARGGCCLSQVLGRIERVPWVTFFALTPPPHPRTVEQAPTVASSHAQAPSCPRVPQTLTTPARWCVLADVAHRCLQSGMTPLLVACTTGSLEMAQLIQAAEKRSGNLASHVDAVGWRFCGVSCLCWRLRSAGSCIEAVPTSRMMNVCQSNVLYCACVYAARFRRRARTA